MVMPIIDLRDVPARLPELLAWGEANTEVLVMDGTTPFAQYVPLVNPPPNKSRTAADIVLKSGRHRQRCSRSGNWRSAQKIFRS